MPSSSRPLRYDLLLLALADIDFFVHFFLERSYVETHLTALKAKNGGDMGTDGFAARAQVAGDTNTNAIDNGTTATTNTFTPINAVDTVKTAYTTTDTKDASIGGEKK